MDVEVLVNGDCEHCREAFRAIEGMVAGFRDVDASCREVDVSGDPELARRFDLHACPGVVVGDCLCFIGVPPPGDLHDAIRRTGGPQGAVGLMRRYEARDETLLPRARS